MARTYFVKAYRGQRKCQFTEEGSYSRCGKAQAEHYAGEPGAAVYTMNHSFTQTPIRCESCGEDINIGDPYKWVKPRPHRATPGRKRSRHSACPGWKQSELTSSAVLSAIYGAQESAESDFAVAGVPTDEDSTDDFTSALEGALQSFASEIEGASEMRREAADAIAEGFGHETSTSEQLVDDAEALESWAQEIEQVSFDSFSGENTEEALEDWADEQRGKAEEAIYENPL